MAGDSAKRGLAVRSRVGFQESVVVCGSSSVVVRAWLRALTLLAALLASLGAAAQPAPIDAHPAPEPGAQEVAPAPPAAVALVAPQPTPGLPGDETNPVHVKLIDEKKPDPLTKQLIKYGVSFGVAAAVLTPVGTGDADQTSTALTAMPYAVVVPSYFWLTAPRREYCAARGLGISRATARSATNSYAHALAAEAFAEQRASGLGPYALTEEARRAPSFNQLSSGEQEGLISAYTGWNAGEADKACHTWWGIYAGVPLAYEANFGDEREARKVRTRGSFGLALLPLTYLHVLIGMTSVAAKREVFSARYQHAWQLTFSIGGSVDVFAPLFRGLGY